MMSGHGANPIVFNKKKLPPTSDNISFLPYPTPTPSLKVKVIHVSPLILLIASSSTYTNFVPFFF